MSVVMMVGMMTPSAAPIILIYARVGRGAGGRNWGSCAEIVLYYKGSEELHWNLDVTNRMEGWHTLQSPFWTVGTVVAFSMPYR